MIHINSLDELFNLATSPDSFEYAALLKESCRLLCHEDENDLEACCNILKKHTWTNPNFAIETINWIARDNGSKKEKPGSREELLNPKYHGMFYWCITSPYVLEYRELCEPWRGIYEIQWCSGGKEKYGFLRPINSEEYHVPIHFDYDLFCTKEEAVEAYIKAAKAHHEKLLDEANDFFVKALEYIHKNKPVF
jgi:hypothetical protein